MRLVQLLVDCRAIRRCLPQRHGRLTEQGCLQTAVIEAICQRLFNTCGFGTLQVIMHRSHTDRLGAGDLPQAQARFESQSQYVFRSAHGRSPCRQSDPPYGGHFAGHHVQRRLACGKRSGEVEHHSRAAEKVFSFGPERRSPSSRNGVQNQPGILFGFIAESCSASPGFPSPTAKGIVRNRAAILPSDWSVLWQLRLSGTNELR